MKSKGSNFSRRQFLQRTVQGVATMTALPLVQNASASESGRPATKSRVVVVTHDNAFHDEQFDADVIQVMMDNGIVQLTGIQDVGEAWKSLFPGITTGTVIGIKINCVNLTQYTHPPVTYSVINGLKRMKFEGTPFPENNIIVWDQREENLEKDGYTINKSSTGVRFFGNPSHGSTIYTVDGGKDQNLSTLITETCNYFINLSVMKNHFTGVSLSMKNNYGNISDVEGHGMHDYPLRTQLPSLNSAAPIREKQAVCICDGILATIANGPDWLPQAMPKCIILSRDTVAHDYTGAQIMKDYGCETTSLTEQACHIAAASAAPYNLGTCNPEQIERIDVVNPDPVPDTVDTTVTDRPGATLSEEFTLLHNYPNPFNGSTILSYKMEESSKVRLSVFDAKGGLVRVLADCRQGPGFFQTEWNGDGADGSRIPSGTYLAVLETGTRRLTVKMQLIQ